MSKPAKERVYDYIRQLVIEGKAAAGTFIEEQEISAKVGVSRTPVREAFLRLEAEHFIDLIPRRGALVRQVTVQELTNVYEARRLIEIHAVRRICEDRVLALPEGVAELLERMAAALAAGNFLDHLKLDMEFHHKLVATTHNDVLITMYDSLQGRKLAVAFTAFKTNPSRGQLIMKQHNMLWQALKARDSAQAEAVIKEHLRPVHEVIDVLPKR